MTQVDVKIKLGPLLGVENNNQYTLCIVLPKVEMQQLFVIINNTKVACVYEEHLQQYYFYRFEFTITEENKNFNYHLIYKDAIIENKNWTFTTISANPTFAYSSCVGPELKEPYTHNNYLLFEDIISTQKDFLILGGDQVYADGVYENVLDKKYILNGKKIKFEQLTKADQLNKLELYYEHLYINSWSIPAIQNCLATIPNIMNWDDHDIVDGYGSLRIDYQNKDTTKLLFKVAKKYYTLLQQRSLLNNSIHICLNETVQVLEIKNKLFILLDTRTNRTKHRIIKYGLNYIIDHLKLNNYKNIRNMYWCIPSPLVHKDILGANHIKIIKLDRLLTRLLNWRLEILDDSIDQWGHNNHKQEKLAVLKTISNVSTINNNIKSTTILSGDIHQGGYTIISSKTLAINQLVASPISNNPIKKLAAKIWDWTSVANKNFNNYTATQQHINGVTKFTTRNYVAINNNKACFVSLQLNKKNSNFVIQLYKTTLV